MSTTISRLFLPALAAAALAGAVAGSGVVASGARHAPPAPMLATVDLEKVFNSLDELAARNDELKAYRATLQSELEKLQQQAKDEDSKRMLLPDGPEKKAAAAKIIEMQLNLKVKTELYNALMDQRQSEMVRALYDKIADAARRLSTASKYTMVLVADDKVALPSAGSTNDVQRVISMKRMLFAAPEADITTDLLTMMNNEYRAGGGKPAPAPTAPAK